MKNLLASLTFLTSFSAFAQPYNPDADGNGSIGAGDLLPFLELFGQPFQAIDSTCVYYHTVSCDPCYLETGNPCWIDVPVCENIVFLPGGNGCNPGQLKVFMPDDAPEFFVITFFSEGIGSSISIQSNELEYGPASFAPLAPVAGGSYIGNSNGVGRASFQFFDGKWWRMNWPQY